MLIRAIILGVRASALKLLAMVQFENEMVNGEKVIIFIYKFEIRHGASNIKPRGWRASSEKTQINIF